MAIYNSGFMIKGIEESWNQGEAVLTIAREIGE
jgi:hypothetical protein